MLLILCKLTAHEDINAVLRALPDEWRRKFSSWMIESYDNDASPSTFIMLDSAVGEVPEKALIIGRIREWIAASRSTASQGQQVPLAGDRRKRMLELVQRAHEKQSRNNGRIPYWMHLLAVAQIVDWVLDTTGELSDDDAREDLFLAALGHDLYEDTAVQPIDVRLQFGERVDAWIQAMTNDGDQDRTAYLARMAAASEEVRLLKLADLTENTASVSYAIVDMGLQWTQTTFLPIVREMRDLVERSRFDVLGRSATLLKSLLDYNFERLQRNLEMFELAEEMKRTVPQKQPGTGKPAPQQISPEAWERALERTRERECKQGERFKGRIFPIPDKDE